MSKLSLAARPFAVAVFALLGLFGTASSSLAETVKISLAGVTPSRTVYYIALQKGYFKDEGVEIEEIKTNSGSDGLKMLVAGRVDLHSSQLIDLLLANKRGANVKGVTLLSARMDTQLLIRKPLADTVKSIRDLKGHTVGVTGVGSGTWQVLMYLGKQEGMSPDDFKVIPVGVGAAVVGAMKSGRIDALSYSPPETLQLIADGDAAYLVNMGDEATHKKYIGNTYVGGIFMASADWIKDNGPSLQRIMNAMQRALNWMNASSVDEVVKVLGSYPGYQGFNPSFLRYFVENRLPNLQKTAAITEEAYQSAVKLPLTIGAIDAVPPLAAVIDNSFADTAAQKYPPAAK